MYNMFVMFVLHKDWESVNPKPSASPILRAALPIKSTKHRAEKNTRARVAQSGKNPKVVKGHSKKPALPLKTLC